MNTTATKPPLPQTTTYTAVNVKNEKTTELEEESEEYEYITDGRISCSSDINLEYDDMTANTDEDNEAEMGDNSYISEEVTEEEEEEELLSNSASKEVASKAGNMKSNEKAKCRQIITVPVVRGRGRPKKNATESVLIQQTNFKQTGKFSQIKTRKSTRGRRRAESIGDARSPKICDICGNSYKYQHALNAHMRRHNNERPFSCEFCEKSFVACVELQRHMRVHTGVKPYACKFCDRRFSDFGSRLKHERTHTGERPYRCTTCDKSFAYAHVLSVHIRTHTGEKRFPCLRCGRGFTKKAYLLAHQEQHGSKHGCVGKEEDDIKSLVTVDESMFTEEEFIVEELNEIDMLPKEEFNVEEEVVQDDDLNEITTEDHQHILLKAKTETEQRDELERIIRRVIEEKLDVKGSYAKPTLWDILWVQIVIFPYTIVRYAYWYAQWIWKFTIMRYPYGREEQLYLIRKHLKMGQHQFDAQEDHQIEEYLHLELWKKENFDSWKIEQDEEMKKKLADNPRYKAYRRYMKNHGPGRLTFED